MRHLFRTFPYLPSLFWVLLLTCAPLQALAVPWSTSTAEKLNSQFSPQRYQSSESQSWKLRNVFPQMAWLRDTAVEKWFGIPPKAAKPGIDKYPVSSQLPATLLAKYGGDVVLRFNLTTPDDEKMLAEAADTLFLDVWEFTSNWADIRLREDDVGSAYCTPTPDAD